VEPLVLAVVLLAAASGLGLGTFAYAWRRVRRSNRVCRHLPSLAPITWLWSPFAAARLHRRLRRCAVTVEEALPRTRRGRQTWPALSSAADQLARHAADVDAHVVEGHYARRLRAAAYEVDEVERLAARLLALGRAWERDDFASRRAQDLRDRIDALEQATREVARVNAIG
jgi:hypothetical protein